MMKGTLVAFVVCNHAIDAFVTRPVAFRRKLGSFTEFVDFATQTVELATDTPSADTNATGLVSPTLNPFVKEKATGAFDNEKQGKNNSPKKEDDASSTAGEPECRIVAVSDGKLPALPRSVLHPHEHVLDKLDAIYHAMAHEQTRRLEASKDEEEEVVPVIRQSLQDSGFQLLTRRDLDVCEALNVGYTQRLSIVPDVSGVEPGMAQEFYPEHFHSNGTALDDSPWLFDGRVLIYWRGYSSEIKRGRLLLSKLDYLQASLVQRSAAVAKERLSQCERFLLVTMARTYRKAMNGIRSSLATGLSMLPDNIPAIESTREKLMAFPSAPFLPASAASSKTSFFTLGRYGGSKIRFVGSPNPTDALTPFLVCRVDEAFRKTTTTSPLATKVDAVNRDIYKALDEGDVTCQYDARGVAINRPLKLLKRVSLGNLMDVFSESGRRNLVRNLVSQSELQEPTYGEVVVIWRPKPKTPVVIKPKWKPPKFLYELADMFDFKLFGDDANEKDEPHQQQAPPPLQVQTFDHVPMANLPAVLPKTKLVFRPADAFVFDMISIVSLLLLLGSQRFDNPKLDLLALISVVLWSFRTVIRYSNKLARYDLLVKTFLNSKMSYRNEGAVNYLLDQAAEQRATRAALVYAWLLRRMAAVRSMWNVNATTSSSSNRHLLTKTQLERAGEKGVLELLPEEKRRVSFDISAALQDLQDVRLIKFRNDGELENLRNPSSVSSSLRPVWNKLFDNNNNRSDKTTRTKLTEKETGMDEE